MSKQNSEASRAQRDLFCCSISELLYNEYEDKTKHRRKGICARLRATGPAAIIDYHQVHLNHITKLLAMTNS